MKRVILVIVALSIFFSIVSTPAYAQEQPKRYLNIGADPQMPGGFKDKDIPRGWFRYINPRDVEVTCQNRHGKWVTGILPAGREVIAKLVEETPTDDGCVVRKYLYGWIVDCGNKLEPICVMVTAKMRDTIVVEIIEVRQKVIEKIVYRDKEVEKISYLYIPITIREVTTVKKTVYEDRFILIESGDVSQQPHSTKVAMPNEGKSEWYTPPPIWNPNFYVFDVDNSNSNSNFAEGGIGEAAAAAAAAASSSSSSSSTSTTPTSGAGAGGSSSGGSGAATSSP